VKALRKGRINVIAASPAKSPEAVNHGFAAASTGDFFNGIDPKRAFSILSAKILHWCKLDRAGPYPNINRVFGTI
jgi:hypothetical protein